MIVMHQVHSLYRLIKPELVWERVFPLKKKLYVHEILTNESVGYQIKTL